MSTKDVEVVEEGTAVVRTKPARMSVSRPSGSGIQPQELMKLAIDKGEAGVEMLKELVELQRRVDDETARKAWHAAVSRFQAECPPIPKSKQGHVGNYAPLGRTLVLVRPALSANGLSATWTTRRYPDDPMQYKVCMLAHEMGHVKEAECPIILDENAGISREGKETLNAMQKYGIADTYAERYTFEAVTGLQPSESKDTDGSVPRAPTVTQPKAKTPPESKPPAKQKEAEKKPDEAAPSSDVKRIQVSIKTADEYSGKKSNGDPWERVDAICSDGEKMSTFSDGFRAVLMAAAGTGETLDIVYREGRYGRMVVDILSPDEGEQE